eukprot:SAG22_NODE_14260_length_380_cov_0.722420_1_plen_90_part_01
MESFADVYIVGAGGVGCKVCGKGPVGVGVVDGMADCRDSPMSRAGEPIGSNRGDPAGRRGAPGGASPHGDPTDAPADDVLGIILGAESDE